MNDRTLLFCDACGMRNPPVYKDTRCTTCCPQTNGMYDIGLDGLYGVGKTTSLAQLLPQVEGVKLGTVDRVSLMITALKRAKDAIDHDARHDAYKDIDEVLETLDGFRAPTTPTDSGWIMVSDEVPDDSRPVDVVREFCGSARRNCDASYNGQGVWTIRGSEENFSVDDVFAWRERPDLPDVPE